jgi:NAD(P)-dependent dehydrogenase (short-subunit alcohol dehydrogenase family)
MSGGLAGKLAVVTGGTSGIARDSAMLFVKAGAKVGVTGRREAEGKETLELMRAAEETFWSRGTPEAEVYF